MNQRPTFGRAWILAGLAAAVAIPASEARRSTTTAPTPTVVTNNSAPVAPTKMFRLESATIPEIQEVMESGALTSVELVTMYLRRIQAYNQASGVSPTNPLNAIGELNPELLEDAAQADRLRRQGVVLGPLHGVPFMVKWSFSISNMPITGGVNGWRNLVTQDETWTVRKMRQAGGIAMGHANMDNWASSAGNSTSQIRGAVRSAYLTGALPGGSSGGSGVSTGAYLATFTFGGETGGSIRNPADRSGSVGYKVSGGSISVDKIIPLVPERDVIGPITRYTIDNALVRDVVGPLDPNDLWAPGIPILADKRPVPEGGFAEAVSSATLEGKKIGIMGIWAGLSHPNPGEGATGNTTNVSSINAGTLALIEQAKADMEAAGAEVEFVFMPPEVSTTFNRGPDAPVTRLLGAPFSNQVASFVYRSLIESIVGTKDDTYNSRAEKVIATANLVTNISNLRTQMMYDFDEETGNYSPGEAISFASPEAQEHFMARRDQKNAFEDWMDAEGLDAVVWPVWTNKSPTGGGIIARDLVNFMHLPAVTVPMGVLQHDETRSEPLTLNITGRLYDDVNVLAIARAYEEATKHRYSPPLAPPLAGEMFPVNRQAVKPFTTDRVPPVLMISPVATMPEGEPTQPITITGTVMDAGGIDRLEISVGGVSLPAMVTGTSWAAVLPADSAASLYLSGRTSFQVIALAVDKGGNASADVSDVDLMTL